MRYSLFIAVFLSSCFGGNEHLMVQQSLSPKKQKQKIAFLQKKLELAEKEQKRVATDIEELSIEINNIRLALIRKQLDEHENGSKKHPKLFQEEREALYRMIEEGPSPTAFEAQVALDRILRLITELSDKERGGYTG